jgi:hypothetical protein
MRKLLLVIAFLAVSCGSPAVPVEPQGIAPSLETATAVFTPTVTAPAPATDTPFPPSTATASCTPATSISLGDVGETLCIYGTVTSVGNDNGIQYVHFAGTDFKLITYNAGLAAPQAGDCIRTEGIIKKPASYPAIIFDTDAAFFDCNETALALEQQATKPPIIGPANTEPPASALATEPPIVQPSATNPPPTQAPPTEAPPTAQPQPTAAPTGFTLLDLSSPLSPGAYASAAVQTSPGAVCSIVYVVPSGRISTAQGLDVQTADGSGVCRWRWKIGTNTNPGTGSVRITANGVTQSFPIVIQ